MKDIEMFRTRGPEAETLRKNDDLKEYGSQTIRLEAMPNPASESIRVLAELPGQSKGVV